MLSSVEQAFVGREEIRAPLKTPAWEARLDVDIDEILFGTKNSISMETAVSQKPAKNETLTKRTSSL